MQAHLTQDLKTSLNLKVKHRLLQSVDVLACSLLDLNGLLNDYAIKNPFLKIKNNNFNNVIDINQDDQYSIESIEQPITLCAHLKAQLAILKLNDDIKIYTNIIINSLDDDGYLRILLSDLVKDLGLSESLLNQALSVVQGLEPIGIAARSLAECFYLQLKAQNKISNQILSLIDNFDEISIISHEQLAYKCNVSTIKLHEMIEVLRSLNPNPGKDFVYEAVTFIEPDIVLVRNKDDAVEAHTNKDYGLRVYFDKKYFNEVYSQVTSKSDKEFLQNCHQEAKNIIEDLEKRKNSIFLVSNYIVSKQQDYLLGRNTLQNNIKQRDIALDLNIHESTVSRSINNKFFSYQGKTIALKKLLGNSAAASDDIALQIQVLINNEKSDNILSDEDIVKKLNDQGISIARRTVAKYRTQLNIPSSLKRRQKWLRYG